MTDLKGVMMNFTQIDIHNEYLKSLELDSIIRNENIHTVFQPIYDLGTGDIFAAESLSRIDGPSTFSGPEDLFNIAGLFDMTACLEKLCRRKALTTASDNNFNTKITINVCPSILSCPGHEKGFTAALYEELFDYKKDIIIELTEKYYIKDHKVFNETVKYYKDQGFKVAIDDLGAGFSGLNMLIGIEPYMVKLDRGLISGIYKNTKKKLLVDSLVSFCKKIGALTVAEGIETEKELITVMQMGVDLGQGYLLGKPDRTIENENRKIKELLNYRKYYQNIRIHKNDTLETLIEESHGIDENEQIKEAVTYFKEKKDKNCLVALSGRIPVGIIFKDRLFFKLGQQYGFDLFSRKSLSEVMEKGLVVDKDTLIEDVVKDILDRDEKNINDSVILTRNRNFLGIVKVHKILEWISSKKINMAKQANPLTGLPGNNIIRNVLEDRLYSNSLFSVLYFDIDNFKPFNDCFGFDTGDNVIAYLGKLIESTIKEWDISGFSGHIGGDDFIAVTGIKDVAELSSDIIQKFDSGIKQFHDSETIQRGYYTSVSRNGQTVRYPVLSLSIAVVSTKQKKINSIGQLAFIASEVKKKVKTCEGSNYFIDRRFGEKSTVSEVSMYN